MSRECRCTVCLLLLCCLPLCWSFYSFSPSSLHQARGHLKDKHMGRRLERRRRVREQKRRRKREKVSELRGIGLKRNSRDGVVCLGWKRTLGGC